LQQIAPIMGHVLWLLSRRPLPPQGFPWPIKPEKDSEKEGRNETTRGENGKGNETEEKKTERRECKEEKRKIGEQNRGETRQRRGKKTGESGIEGARKR